MNKIYISKHIAWQIEKTKGYIYVLNILNKKYFKLDYVAKDIWEFIVEGFDTNEMAEKLSNKYIVDKQTIVNDINEFLIDLKQKDVIYS